MPTGKVRSYSDLTRRLIRLAERIPEIDLHLLGKVRAGAERYPFWTLTTPAGPKKRTICLSGGIHGDEPAGVEAVLGALEMLKKRPRWIDRSQFTIFPCINPYGYEYGTRQNRSKIDLNRQFMRAHPAGEVRLMKRVLDGRTFDLSIEFHEDIDTPGFYLYELSKDPKRAIAKKIIRRVEKKYPINLGEEIEGAPAKGGVISPDLSSGFFKERLARRRQWPHAIYQYKQGTPHTLTSETPIHLGAKERVEIHLIVLKTAMEGLIAPRE